MIRKSILALSVATLATSAAILPGAQAQAVDTQTQLAASHVGACNPCNPCAAAKACNPCNPCAAAKLINPCNPCAAAKACNPCNPCAAKANPCNPCAATTN